ncbi:hypothetical protein FBD94_07985 [Pedobacter hiemivivus]|uniref:Uncharacterized protein n=1 Tax=Pedobacter hiemivivus TaxID=2530454 RepID=A0A4U1GH02_9SPHI|nr:three component ABC system middle component [Pedobacter hiemivivus]TKC62153.1 hypothetical protein FBD94_07985 [Pedobacter hiemivivus]
MKEIYYTYNNEAIASCVFLSVMKEIQTWDIARSCLILPFLLDDKTVKWLKNYDPSEYGIYEVFKSRERLFMSFNKRYLALLPVSINALLLLSKSQQISIGKDIRYSSKLEFIGVDFGERFVAIQEVIPNFLALIENLSTVSLYQLLKVQL